MRFSETESRLIGHCIRELEARTQAEVVLVVRKTSGHYKDVSYLVGAAAAFVAVGFALFTPWEIEPLAIPMPVLAVFLGAAWATQHSRVRVWLTTRKRRSDQVRKAAYAAFFEKQVHETSTRAGILLYCSRFEKQALILPDHCARECLPPERLAEFERKLAEAGSGARPAQSLAEFLGTFGIYLGRVLPWDEATQGPKKDELHGDVSPGGSDEEEDEP
jgi:uncharacterized membrane protein